MVVVDGRICRKEADSETILRSGEVVINAVQGRHQKGLYRNTSQDVTSSACCRYQSRIKNPFVRN